MAAKSNTGISSEQENPQDYTAQESQVSPGLALGLYASSKVSYQLPRTIQSKLYCEVHLLLHLCM